VRVVANPINTDAFTPGEPRPREDRDELSVMYTGRVHPEKGIDLLIRAFVQLHDRYPHLRLRIVGPVAVEHGGGGDGYLAMLKELAGDKPVDFEPPTYDQRELAAKLREADFYCYPSLADKGESFGVAPLEAMATGLAPVVSDLACFADFTEHGRTAIVFDHHSDQAVDNLVAALEQLVADPARAREMGRAAAERALDFSCQRIAERYIEVFRELNGSPQAHGPN